MNGNTQLAKLSALRARTDRELLAIIVREVELGLALTCASKDRRDIQGRARAERAYSLAATLLPTIHMVQEQEKRAAEDQLERLCWRLHALRASAA